MKTSAAFGLLVCCLFTHSLFLPPATSASPDTQGHRAGEISRLIPMVSIQHGGDVLNGSEKSPLYWTDVVNTQAGGRARMSLDDGSVLNLGSNSRIVVTKHDAAAQHTELAMGLGKMRVRVQKISQPNGKFEVRTPIGVAGVIGTDFYLAYANGQMMVLVFAGRVKACNLVGECVEVGAGEMSTTSSADFGGRPTPAVPAPPAAINEATSSTSLDTAVEINQREAATLGIVTHASDAHLGNSPAAKGAPVYSGDLLSTGPGGALAALVGSLAVKLQGDSTARIYRASYGAVVELDRGGIEYKTPGQPQGVVIVASDVRITPASGAPASGRITLPVPCNLKVQSRTGQLYVLEGSKSRVIQSGRTLNFFQDYYFVSNRQGISPDSEAYHREQHWACGVGSGTDFAFLNSPGNTNSGSGTSVPEPSSLDLLCIGFLALVGLKLKRLLAWTETKANS